MRSCAQTFAATLGERPPFLCTLLQPGEVLLQSSAWLTGEEGPKEAEELAQGHAKLQVAGLFGVGSTAGSRNRGLRARANRAPADVS